MNEWVAWAVLLLVGAGAIAAILLSMNKCPACGGTGTTSEGAPCAVCRGGYSW